MPHVELDDKEWQQVMAMISNAPWRDANPLLMKIGQQLQSAQDTYRTEAVRQRYNAENKQPEGNGKEATHE